MNRRRLQYGPQMQYERDWHREIMLTVGVLALVVGAFLVVGIAVTL